MFSAASRSTISARFYDLEDKLALGNAEACGSLEELLERAETVTLHVDGRGGNTGLYGAEQFSRMRRRSLFLNLSRGFVVDHEALRDHLLSGHIAGAAVDVFPDEPKSQGDEFSSVLRGLPNVILTPHVGGSTQEAQYDIGRFVAGKLVDYSRTGTTTLSVNLAPQPQRRHPLEGSAGCAPHAVGRSPVRNSASVPSRHYSMKAVVSSPHQAQIIARTRMTPFERCEQE